MKVERKHFSERLEELEDSWAALEETAAHLTEVETRGAPVYARQCARGGNDELIALLSQRADSHAEVLLRVRTRVLEITALLGETIEQVKSLKQHHND